MLKVVNLVMAMGVVSSVTCREAGASSAVDFATLFSEIGFSPSCVSKSLALCENTLKTSVIDEIKTPLNLILDIIAKLKGHKNPPRTCADLLHRGDTQSGVRTVYTYSCCPNRPVSVFCDQTTDGGGWTVFQHSQSLSQWEDFFCTWVEYRLGFGNLDGSEFWLGLDTIHTLSSDVLMELLVDLEDFEGKKRWAMYDSFYIGDTTERYRIAVGSYSGNAGVALVTEQNGQQFSTNDQDNDSNDKNCAQVYKGAWWYGSCHHSNLNGFPYEGNHTSFADGINWYQFRGYNYSLRRTSLNIRPKYYPET